MISELTPLFHTERHKRFLYGIVDLDLSYWHLILVFRYGFMACLVSLFFQFIYFYSPCITGDQYHMEHQNVLQIKDIYVGFRWYIWRFNSHIGWRVFVGSQSFKLLFLSLWHCYIATSAGKNIPVMLHTSMHYAFNALSWTPWMFRRWMMDLYYILLTPYFLIPLDVMFLKYK